MPPGDIETFHANGAWHNRIEGYAEVLFTHQSRDAAIAEAGELAHLMKSSHVIRNEDGTVEEVRHDVDAPWTKAESRQR